MFNDYIIFRLPDGCQVVATLRKHLRKYLRKSPYVRRLIKRLSDDFFQKLVQSYHFRSGNRHRKTAIAGGSP